MISAFFLSVSISLLIVGFHRLYVRFSIGVQKLLQGVR